MWIAITLACALSLALSDALVKLTMRLGTGHYAAGWYRVFLSALPLMAVLALIERPQVQPAFYWAVGVSLPFEALALYLHTKALKVSPMSLTLPFLAFTPAFVIFVAWGLAAEKVSASGTAGILLMVAGGYVLNLNHLGRGIMGPLKAIGREKGSLLMLGVAAIYSLTATLIKVGINNSSPLYFACVYFLLLPVIYLPFARRQIRSVSPRALWTLALAGALQFIMVITHVIAVSMVKVAYMVSVKRTSLLFGVLLGWMIFKEQNIRQRAAGAAIMLAGFIIVVMMS